MEYQLPEPTHTHRAGRGREGGGASFQLHVVPVTKPEKALTSPAQFGRNYRKRSLLFSFWKFRIDDLGSKRKKEIET